MTFYIKKLVIGAILVSITMPTASPISKDSTRIISYVAGGLTGILASYGVYKLIKNGKIAEAKKALQQVKESDMQDDAGDVTIDSVDNGDVVLSDSELSATISLSAAEWCGVILVGVATGVITKYAAQALFDYFEVGKLPVTDNGLFLIRLPNGRDVLPEGVTRLSPQDLQNLPAQTECQACLDDLRAHPALNRGEHSLGEGHVHAACNHNFHEHCLHKWILTQRADANRKANGNFYATCPICRVQPIATWTRNDVADVPDVPLDTYGDGSN